MGDSVERAMEETIQLMKKVQRARLLTNAELTDVTRRRRDHEYRLVGPKVPRSAFLAYAEFEKRLSELLKQRATKRGVKRNRADHIVHATATRANLVYSRAVKRFKGDNELWLHYARHLIEAGSHKAAAKILGRALAMRPDAEDIWLAAIALHADTMGDTGGARKLSMRALRSLPDNKTRRVFETYFRVELSFLCKSIARRVALRVPVGVEVGGDDQSNKEEKKNLVLTVLGDDEGEQEQKKESVAPGETDEMKDLNEERSEIDGKDADADERIEEQEDDEKKSDDDDENEENYNELAEMSVSSVSDDEESEPQAPEPKRTLNYMRGGIPLAVFRQARKRVKLLLPDLLSYWKIAIEMPYTPWQLVQDMHLDIAADKTDEYVSEIMAARLQFDIAMAKLKHIPPPQGLKLLETDGAELKDEDTSAYDAAVEAVKTAAENCRDALVGVLGDGSKQDMKLVLPLVNGFAERAKSFLTKEDLQDLMTHLSDMCQRETPGDGNDVSEMTLKQVAEAGTIAAWTHFLEKTRDARGAEKNKVRKALMETIAVPFRNDEKDQIAIIWVAWENELERLVECMDMLMALPPQSERFLRAALIALKKMLVTLEKERRRLCACRLGKVYERLTSLKSGRNDVDLWIDYIEFERDIRMDYSKSSSLEWKAKKLLPPTKAELFTEKILTRHLLA